jgi:hypothetical protein
MTIAWSDIEADGSLMRPMNEDIFNTTYDATLTSGSAVIAMDSTVGIEVGHIVNGTGIVDNSVVQSVIENTSITIDNNVTDTGTDISVVIQTYSDADLAALHKDAAKTFMYQDLWKAFSNDPDQATLIDDLANNNQTGLEITLGYKQLAMYYQYNKDYYNDLYAQDKSKFGTLKQTAVPAVSTGRILI